MALRNKIFLACESFLRVPPLLIVDEIFRYSFGLGYGGKFVQYGAILTLKTDGDSFFSSNDANTDEGTQTNTSADSPIPEDILPSGIEESISIFPQAPAESDGWFSTSWLEGVVSSVNVSDLWNTVSSSVSSDASSPSQSFDSVTSLASSEETVVSQTSDNIAESTAHLLQVEFGDWDTLKDVVTDDVFKFVEVLACLIVFAAVLVVFVLSTKNLVKLYSYVLAFSSLYLAYILNPIPMTLGMMPAVLFNVFIRCVLVGTYFLTRSWPGGYPTHDYRLSRLCSVLDGLIFSMFFITGVVRFQPAIYFTLAIILQTSLWVSLPKIYEFLQESWEDTKRTRNQYGISHLIQVESGRLKINTVFRLFWISRAVYDIFNRVGIEPFPQVVKYVLTNGSETLLGVTGLTVTVSAVCHQIGAFLLWILYYGTNAESDANRFGSISTVLFFILSLQTGLTTLSPEKRLDRLFKNIVLLGTALFHALHQVLAPLLHAFRSFQALQIRAALLSITFLGFSVASTLFLLRTSVLSTWSLAVLALAIEFKIKIIISLMISVVVYLSQLVQYPEFFQRIGQWFRDILPQDIVRFFAQLHDQLSHEDMVFYLKSFAHFAEFITGIFLFVNAVWIFLFESASAIRAIGMAIHAYFNIWCEAKKGYRIYCQRRTASRKIESLADASEVQLQLRRDDVCAICYEEMESAKVTHCGHLFHAVCLRKWLYVQNTCPLCHEVLYAVEAVSEVQRRARNEAQVHLNGHAAPVNDQPARNILPFRRNSALNNNVNQPAEVQVAPNDIFNDNDLEFFSPRTSNRNVQNLSDTEDEASSSGAWTDVELSDSERELTPGPASSLLRPTVVNLPGASQQPRLPDNNNANNFPRRRNGEPSRLFMSGTI